MVYPATWLICIASLLSTLQWTVHATVIPRSVDICGPPTISDVLSTNLAPGTANNGTDASFEPDLEKRWDAQIAARANTYDTEWQDTVAAGKELWARLQSILAHSELQNARVCNLDQRWDFSINTQQRLFIDRGWYDVLPSETEFLSLSESFFAASAKGPKGDALFRYSSEFSLNMQAIVATDIQGRVDVSEEDGPEEWYTAPDRWSDVVWWFWVALSYSQGRNPRDLRWILQENVINERSQDLIHRVIANDSTEEEQEPDTVVVAPGDDKFFGLLRAPNVIGTVYMLMRFPRAMGRKTIKSIGASWDPKQDRYYIWIELKDYEGKAIGTIETK